MTFLDWPLGCSSCLSETMHTAYPKIQAAPVYFSCRILQASCIFSLTFMRCLVKNIMHQSIQARSPSCLVFSYHKQASGSYWFHTCDTPPGDTLAVVTWVKTWSCQPYVVEVFVFRKRCLFGYRTCGALSSCWLFCVADEERSVLFSEFPGVCYVSFQCDSPTSLLEIKSSCFDVYSNIKYIFDLFFLLFFSSCKYDPQKAQLFCKAPHGI